MIALDQINARIKGLPPKYQEEVLHFVEFLSERAGVGDTTADLNAWSDLSLANAMRGLESENGAQYSEADLTERWR